MRWSCFPGLKNGVMTQCFLCLDQKNMVSITRWFYKWVATSQHPTVADNSATSILEINSIPIPLLKRIP